MIHQMRLHAESFEKIKSGQKASELRLNDEKRRQISVGDFIVFANRSDESEKIMTEVTHLKVYSSFRELFEGVKGAYPESTEEDFVKGMYMYYSPEDEAKYGALEIGIRLHEPRHEITAQNVVDFYSELERMGIDIWIDGGWGVDALLGYQTRPHGDLDIIVQQKDVAQIKKYLEDRGYRIIPRDDLSDINFHMGDSYGHEVDFTVIEFDEQGNGIYGPPENGEMNPADSFKGTGTINGKTVRCVAPEYAVQFRTGYELRDIDRQDVKALCEKFHLELPEEYKMVGHND